MPAMRIAQGKKRLNKQINKTLFLEGVEIEIEIQSVGNIKKNKSGRVISIALGRVSEEEVSVRPLKEEKWQRACLELNRATVFLSG